MFSHLDFPFYGRRAVVSSLPNITTIKMKMTIPKVQETIFMIVERGINDINHPK